MRQLGLVCAGLLAALSGCGGKHVAARPSPTAVEPAPAPPPQPVCKPPSLMTVSQVAEDESSRLLIVETATGNVVWQGPVGSGESRPAWTRDGARMAYVVGEDLIVHDGENPDRLAFRGLSEHPSFTWSRDGDWLAATGRDDTVLIDFGPAARASRGAPRATPIELGDCAPQQVRWSPGDRLLLWCSDDSGFRTFDPATRKVVTHDVEEVTAVLGWWPGAGDVVVIERDDGSVWRVPLPGEAQRLFDDRSSESGLVSEALVTGTDAVLFSDYDPGDGFPRTLWLAPHGSPPVAWLDGVISHLSFSSDGAWAAFATATDTVDEAGDIYFARVGRPAVTRVLSAPVDLDDEDETYDEEVEDAVYFVGFAHPAFRPELESHCRSALPAPRQRVEVALEIDEDNTGLQAGGVVLDENPDAPQLVIGGDRPVTLDDSLGWSAARRLRNGVVLARDDRGGTHWFTGTGDLVTTVTGAGEDAVAVGEAGAAWRVGTNTLELRDRGAGVAGTYTDADGIDEVDSRGDGVVVVNGLGRVVSLGPTGVNLGSFDAPDAIVTGLVGGDVVTVDPGPESVDGDDDDGYDTETQTWRVSVVDPRGPVRGRHLLRVDGEVGYVRALPDGGFVVVAGEERSKAFFFDARGKLRGTFKLGLLAERPPAVMADGTVVFVGPGERDLLLTDSRGSYLAGLTLEQMIVEGPYAIAPDRLAVEVDDGIVILARRRL